MFFGPDSNLTPSDKPRGDLPVNNPPRTGPPLPDLSAARLPVHPVEGVGASNGSAATSDAPHQNGTTPNSSKSPSALFDLAALREFLTPEQIAKLQSQAPITAIMVEMVGVFDKEQSLTPADRPEYHRQILSRLNRALWSIDGNDKVQLPPGSNPERIAADELVERVLQQALRNLVRANLSERIFPLSLDANSQQAPVSSNPVPSELMDLECAFDRLLIGFAIRCGEHRKWALNTVHSVFLQHATRSFDLQVHVGPTNDIEFLGYCYDLLVRSPESKAQLYNFLGTFLPARHVDLFVREYEKSRAEIKSLSNPKG